MEIAEICFEKLFIGTTGMYFNGKAPCYISSIEGKNQNKNKENETEFTRIKIHMKTNLQNLEL